MLSQTKNEIGQGFINKQQKLLSKTNVVPYKMRNLNQKKNEYHITD